MHQNDYATYDRALSIYEGAAVQVEAALVAFNLLVDSLDITKLNSSQYIDIREWQTAINQALRFIRKPMTIVK